MNENENEKNIGVVHVGLTQGAKTTYFDLVFTTSRIVFAKTGGLHIAWFAIWFFFAGIGAVIYTLIAMSKRNGTQRQLSEKSAEDILKLSGENYSAPYSELMSIRIFDRRKLEIVTTGNRKVFVLFGSTTANVSKAQVCEYAKIIKDAAPEKFVQ